MKVMPSFRALIWMARQLLKLQVHGTQGEVMELRSVIASLTAR